MSRRSETRDKILALPSGAEFTSGKFAAKAEIPLNRVTACLANLYKQGFVTRVGAKGSYTYTRTAKVLGERQPKARANGFTFRTALANKILELAVQVERSSKSFLRDVATADLLAELDRRIGR